MTLKRIYFCYLKTLHRTPADWEERKKKTAHLGGKCEANNGMTPANRGITPANRQKKTANKGGVYGKIPV